MNSRRKLLWIASLAVLSAGSAGVFLKPTLFLNAHLTRLGEPGLPRIEIREDLTVHCRMRAADFSFPLPPGVTPLETEMTGGGYDSVFGVIEVAQPAAAAMSATEYGAWVAARLQPGGRVSAISGAGGDRLRIRFSYFGDT